VSTYGQTLTAQLDHLRAAGCEKIYREQASGARADRRELLKLLKAIDAGDVVTVTRIHRLARSTFDLFAIVKRIVDAGAQFRSLAEPLIDTGTSTGRLMLAVLGGLADIERDLIRTRMAEGRSRAKAQGKEARQRREEGATVRELARSYKSGARRLPARRGPHERRDPAPHRPRPQNAALLSAGRAAGLVRRVKLYPRMGPHRAARGGVGYSLPYRAQGAGRACPAAPGEGAPGPRKKA
jgi:DNA invertase Pin-like site-specific DNA recombinase